MSRLPIEIKQTALKLRKFGYSVKEIAKELHISQGTSSSWIRYIKLNKKAQNRLRKRKLLKYYRDSLKWQEKRIEKDRQYKLFAGKTIENIKKDVKHTKIYCALLYWCEGGKGYKEGIRFVNSDPNLISTFLRLFRMSFDIDERKFRVLMHLHGYHDENKQKTFWSRLTNIPRHQFLKTFRKPHTGKRIRESYPGCVTIYYNSFEIARRLRAIYNVFSERLGTW